MAVIFWSILAIGAIGVMGLLCLVYAGAHMEEHEDDDEWL
jgi:hypothetical protein